MSENTTDGTSTVACTHLLCTGKKDGTQTLQSEKACDRLADVNPSGQGKGADEFEGQ